MKLLVTGASGFLGEHVVSAALRRGHTVRAMIRPASDVTRLPWHEDTNVEIVRADLRQRRGLEDAVRGCDGVIHLAAAMGGDFYARFAGTVIATEHLLDAMTAAGVKRLIATSSFSVYDYRRLRMGSTLDERSPLEARPDDRDDYARTKLIQEQLVRDRAQRDGLELTVLRPGAVFGAHHLWTARLGRQLGNNRWLRTGAWAHVPFTYVESCAEAFIACIDAPQTIGRTYNVVDDDCPTQRRYVALLRSRMKPRLRLLRANFTLLRSVAALAGLTNRLVFSGRAKLPMLLSSAKLLALTKPLRYTNAALKTDTAWSPRVGLIDALDRSLAAEREAGQSAKD
mgnify:FL=1